MITVKRSQELSDLALACSRAIERSVFAAAQHADMFEILVHDPALMDAVYTLVAAGYPAATIAAKAASPLFTEALVNRLVARRLVAELVKPLLAMKGSE